MEQTQNLQQQPDNGITRNPINSPAADRFQASPAASDLLKSLPSTSTLKVVGNKPPDMPVAATASDVSGLAVIVLVLSVVCCLVALTYLGLGKGGAKTEAVDRPVPTSPVSPEPKKKKKTAPKKTTAKKTKKRKKRQ